MQTCKAMYNVIQCTFVIIYCICILFSLCILWFDLFYVLLCYSTSEFFHFSFTYHAGQGSQWTRTSFWPLNKNRGHGLSHTTVKNKNKKLIVIHLWHCMQWYKRTTIQSLGTDLLVFYVISVNLHSYYPWVKTILWKMHNHYRTIQSWSEILTPLLCT